MTEAEIQHDTRRRRFVLQTNSGPAFVAYQRPDEHTIELHHTIVPEPERGQGVAGRVVGAAFAYARENGLRVVPTCPYVQEWLEEHPEERDIVAA